ncbi:MAG: hypothetical protein R6V47_05155 [Candidatus Delongbacteria bacterium]
MNFDQRIFMKGSKHCFKYIILLLILLCFSISAVQSDEWENIFLNISYFEDDTHPTPNLFDGDPATYSDGRTVFIRLREKEKVTVSIFAGNGKSEEEFFKYSRPKELRLSILSGIHAGGFVTEIATLYKGLNFGDPLFVELDDSYGIQSFELDLLLKEIRNFTRQAEKKFGQDFGLEIVDKCIALKIEVTDVYPGTESQDVFISEVFTGDVYESGSEGNVKISDVFVNDDENAILAATGGDKEIEIYSDPSSVLQLMEVSQNKKWAVVISMPAEIEGRAGTEYLLIDVTKGEIINEKINALYGGMMYFEKPWAGLQTLIFTSNEGGEEKVYLK